jgi:hypothetical protein
MPHTSWIINFVPLVVLISHPLATTMPHGHIRYKVSPARVGSSSAACMGPCSCLDSTSSSMRDIRGEPNLQARIQSRVLLSHTTWLAACWWWLLWAQGAKHLHCSGANYTYAIHPSLQLVAHWKISWKKNTLRVLFLSLAMDILVV